LSGPPAWPSGIKVRRDLDGEIGCGRAIKDIADFLRATPRSGAAP